MAATVPVAMGVRQRRGGLAAVLVVCLAACLPYVSTLHNYFVQDDFGVVQLLAQKPASYFPRWFATTWMDDIWGFIPDEIRPFPAATYQLTALWGAASPVANHALNIALHAANGLLVLAVARTVAGLGGVAATFAALAFVLLPIQAESVAWITGRVDTLPALFYVASFLMYVRWRRGPAVHAAVGHDRDRNGNREQAGSRDRNGGRDRHGPIRDYLIAVILCFVALFSKQNTITLAPALMLYDLIVERRRPRLSWAWIGPYVPFIALTLGYLGLRFLVFGEVAREGQLNAQGMTFFGHVVRRHLRHLVFGSVTGGSMRQWIAVCVALAAVAAAALMRGTRDIGHKGARTAVRDDTYGVAQGIARSVVPPWRSALYFGPIWLALGIAPILVAGYESPRHVYLASLGWATLLGLAFQVLWEASPHSLPPLHPRHPRLGIVWRGLAAVAAVALLVGYTMQLRRVIGRWSIGAAVSQKAVSDLEREALSVPEGSLVLVGVPVSSWEWAMPFAARPPFTRTDVAARVRLVSPLRLHCCRSHWHDYTRRTLQAWLASPGRPPLIALHWDARTGRLSRVSDREEPSLRAMVPILLETTTADALEARIQDVLARLVAGRGGPSGR